MTKPGKQTLYELKRITKTYKIGSVELHALRGVDLRLYQGEFVALRGPSGSGKSTLLNVLGILEQPSGGEMHFGADRLTGMSETKLTLIRRRSVGFVFQNYNLIPVLSALENVEYPLYIAQKYSKAEIKDRAMNILHEVGIAKFADHKPSELSGGQRQRVAIARALVKQPEVVLADEPTANLDSRTAQQIMELIRGLQQKSGTTIVLATHDDIVAAMAERQVHIKDGEIVD